MRLTKYDPDFGYKENHDTDSRKSKNGSRACMDKLGKLEDLQEQGRLIIIHSPEELGDNLCLFCPLPENERRSNSSPSGSIGCEGSRCGDAYNRYCIHICEVLRETLRQIQS